MSPLMYKARKRGIRTFLSGLSGVATAALVIDWTTDYVVGATVVGLGVLTALIAAISAFLLALKDYTADSPLGKSAVQFCQMVGGGLATVAISTSADLVPVAKTVSSLLITAVLSSLATFFLNAAERETVT